MNRSRLLFIGLLALALGAVVSLAVYKNLQSRTVAAPPPGVNAVVAANDIEVGSKIAEKDLRVVRFPEGSIPKGTFRDTTRILGRGAVLPIAAGEFILPNKLAGENAGYGLPALIPPGMRAVSVRVNDTTSVAGFVLPGTRVDVLLTGNPSGAADQQTTTVLENIAVIATGQKLERNSSGEPQMAPVITLLVSPDDAQRLTLASNQGRIQLSLRNPLDTKQEQVASVSAAALYRNGAPVQAASRPRVKHTTVATPPPPPRNHTVEVYRGEKKDEVKFDQ